MSLMFKSYFMRMKEDIFGKKPSGAIFALGRWMRQMMNIDLLFPTKNKQKMCQVNRLWLFSVGEFFVDTKFNCIIFWHQPDINYLHMRFYLVKHFDVKMEPKTINLPKIWYSNLINNPNVLIIRTAYYYLNGIYFLFSLNWMLN